MIAVMCLLHYPINDHGGKCKFLGHKLLIQKTLCIGHRLIMVLFLAKNQLAYLALYKPSLKGIFERYLFIAA